MVLQHKVLCQRTIIGNLARVMIAHDFLYIYTTAIWILNFLAIYFCLFSLAEETIHMTGIDVCTRVFCCMRTTKVSIGSIMERINTFASLGIIHTSGKFPILHGQAVGSWIGTKIIIEGAVLLHDDDNVLDLLAC